MMQFFSTPARIWLGGILLSVLFGLTYNLISGHGVFDVDTLALVRWIHIVAGVLWVGFLYFFIFVQAPAVAAALSDEGGPGPACIQRYLLGRALLWFRWSAVVTWVAGMLYLGLSEQLLNVFSLGLAANGDGSYGFRMGIGAWLGTILLLNVWLLIWPNQRKVLGLVPDLEAAEIAAAKATVAKVGRINAMLSLPMLLFMVGAQHGVAF